MRLGGSVAAAAVVGAVAGYFLAHLGGGQCSGTSPAPPASSSQPQLAAAATAAAPCPVCPAASPAAPPGGARTCATAWSDTQGRPWDHGGDFAKLAEDFRPWLDKVYAYETRYDQFYSRLMDGLRHNGSLRMLEVGLGCWWRRMFSGGRKVKFRGAGASSANQKGRQMISVVVNRPMGFSVEFWRRYFPGVEYYLIEYLDICLQRWKQTISDWGWDKGEGAKYYEDLINKRVFWGSQESPETLQRVRDAVGPRGLDIIVDDGSHDSDHQIRTLHGLWPALRPGGLYVIEDLEMSYAEDRGGQIHRQREQTTAVGYMQRLIADLAYSWQPGTPNGPWEGHTQTKIADEVLSITCGRQICALLKRAVPYREAHNMSYRGEWPCPMKCANGRCACNVPPGGISNQGVTVGQAGQAAPATPPPTPSPPDAR
eukprot:TRINITY_DN5296_c0_g1_i2.p1 TRINITY_DN5296_c0_g1~~TRINITY_DN5296_c0_g1_i2.p1  ORF type:complete len:427 (+),score=46.01 TRINITY_DN5296_c0_g1_i2:78-1358(+)